MFSGVFFGCFPCFLKTDSGSYEELINGQNVLGKHVVDKALDQT